MVTGKPVNKLFKGAGAYVPLDWPRFSPQRYTGERLSGEVTHLPPAWQVWASLMANSTGARNPALESVGQAALAPVPASQAVGTWPMPSPGAVSLVISGAGAGQRGPRERLMGQGICRELSAQHSVSGQGHCYIRYYP